MPSKTEEYLALAQRTANGLTRYWESWTDYLTTASRLYKYPFADQLMIYAQRPDATACADYDVWNSRMNRYVRRGAKGIALLDESSGFPRLHYVFDVSDTGVRRNSRDPEVWQLGPDLVQPVSEMLAATYGISGERVSQQLADVAGKLVADYWDNNGGDIRAIVDGSLLMDYDEAGVEISQIMTSKSPVRSCDDVDEQALSYAEIKALCAGNPLIKEKMDLDVQVAKLKVLKADHQSQKYRLEDKLLTQFPADIQEANAHIAGLKADAQLAAAHPQGKEEFCGMTIKGVAYDEKKTAGERLVLACSELPNAEEKVIGSYRGFELSLRFDAFRTEYQALLKGQRKYTVPLGNDPLGNIIRLDNSLNNFLERITAAENELDTLHQQQAAAQIEVEKPFPQEEELAQKSARLAELNAQLDVDEKHHEPEMEETPDEESARPSVLAALNEKSDKEEPVKPFRSYSDRDGDAR